MTKKLFTKAGVGAIALTMLLTGCAPQENPNEASYTLDWRKSDKEVSGEHHVSQNDVSRQDGEKSIKFTTLRYRDPNTNRTSREDPNRVSIIEVRVVSIIPIEKDAKVDALKLGLDNKARLIPEKVEGVIADTYEIILKTDFVSGFKDPQPYDSIPIFWPILPDGSVAGLVYSKSGATHPHHSSGLIVLHAAVPAGLQAPIGVRYNHIKKNNGSRINPKADIYISETKD